ncbi:pre-mRNA-processing factor 39 isoform X1 [Iris pallida]|uniref:Pre-mRNA-processing factor 39 isoform X1 n=1 Tax=Iris pallida TaxID=29817 RepID=A0AAX6HZR3_IRIPA|nr:pre-mRNA-processing factor 39 isoform X1 [Iris pallida]
MSRKGHLKVLAHAFIDPRREGLRRGPGPAATGVSCHRLVVGWAGVLCYGRNLVGIKKHLSLYMRKLLLLNMRKSSPRYCRCCLFQFSHFVYLIANILLAHAGRGGGGGIGEAAAEIACDAA